VGLQATTRAYLFAECAPLLAYPSSVGCLLEGTHFVLARFPIGIGILAPSKVLALRAVGKVCTSH
jgi:hypothetical protein